MEKDLRVLDNASFLSALPQGGCCELEFSFVCHEKDAREKEWRGPGIDAAAAAATQVCTDKLAGR